MEEHQEIRLKVGQSVSLKKGFIRHYELLYAGMPQKETFSLIVSLAAGNLGQAYNLFFPVYQNRIELMDRTLDIHYVGPEEIRLDFSKTE